MIQKKWYQGSRTRSTNVSDAIFFGDLKNSNQILEFDTWSHKWEKSWQLMLLKHSKITDYSIWNGKTRLFKVFSFDQLSDFVDSFINILEKLSTYMPIIIDLYTREKIAENRRIDKKCEVSYPIIVLNILK